MGGFSPVVKLAEKAGVVKKVNPKSVEQPKVVSQVDAPKPMGSPAGPTDIEMDQDDNLRTKRKGRKNTILTSSQGLGENIELGKKTLLG